jgi:hypothetical protein
LKNKNENEDNILLLKQREKSLSRIIIFLSIIVGIFIAVVLTGILSSIE